MREVLNDYDGWIADEGQQGMETLSMQGLMSATEDLETGNANEYTEIYSFISENGAEYTDMAKGVCPCSMQKPQQ